MSTTKEQMMAVAKASGAGRVWEHPSADEVRVYVGPHYATLTPSEVTTDGVDQDAIRIDVAKSIPGRAGVRAKIADATRAAGLFPRV